MRGFLKNLFYSPKHDTPRRKRTTRVLRAVVAAVLCVCVMGFGVYALFSTSVTSRSNSVAANATYQLDVKIDKTVAGETAAFVTDGAATLTAPYTAAFNAADVGDDAVYTATLTYHAGNQAPTGYCVITVTEGETVSVYYTPQITADTSFTFDITVLSQATVTFAPHWGEAANYADELAQAQLLAAGAGVTVGSEYAVFTPKFAQHEDFLYRVGNRNAVCLGDLFTARPGYGKTGVTAADVKVTVTGLDEETSVYQANVAVEADAADWTKTALRFVNNEQGDTMYYEGPVTVAVQETASGRVCELALEVVAGQNVTDYAQLKAFAEAEQTVPAVMLADVTMEQNGQLALQNATVYGNGFTLNAANGLARYAEEENGQPVYNGTLATNYLVALTDCTVDHWTVIGPVLTAYESDTTKENNFPVVLTAGDTLITNSLIANGAAPVRVNGGTLRLQNTLLQGGRLANLDVRSGHVSLADVTTVNQAQNGTSPVGMGVLIDAAATVQNTSLVINGAFTQYNSITAAQAQAMPGEAVQAAAGALFAAEQAAWQYTVTAENQPDVIWAGTGVVSLSAAVGQTQISDNRAPAAQYVGKAIEGGYVYAPKAAAPQEAPAELSAAPVQAPIAPTVEWNDDRVQDGALQLTVTEGESITWDPTAVAVWKAGRRLPCVVTARGEEVTGALTLNAAEVFTVQVEYDDPRQYGADGKPTGQSVAYSKVVTVTVTERARPAQAAAPRQSQQPEPVVTPTDVVA